MAWVTQTFNHGEKKVELLEDLIIIVDDDMRESVVMLPSCSADAHNWALMLRRAARRLEEIGKELK
jgi:hypothetical protein